MDRAKFGVVVGLLFMAFACAAIAAGYTIEHWTETVAVAQSKGGIVEVI